MTDAKKQFAKRLKQAMKDAGYEAKPSVLEREFNLHYFGSRPMTLHGVRRWLLGETIPAQDKVLALARWLRIEPQALLFGEEPALTVKDERGRWEQAVTHQERETFEAFMALPAAQKKIVREVILAFAKAGAE